MSKTRVPKYVPIVVLSVSILLLFVRCFYSFSWLDESFYLTLVNRLYIGEKMFVDEWYTTQLSAPLLLPFYAAYMCLMGGTEGIYLYFRILYLILSSITAIYAYKSLSKSFSSGIALICSLMYLFYSRANIGGMSYYNVTLTFVLLACLVLAEVVKSENITGRIKFRLILSGIFIAIAVINTPYLLIPYIILVIAMLLMKKRKYYGKMILFSILGSMIVAIGYFVYIFGHVSLNEIIANVPHILNEPELQKTNPVLAIPLIFIRIAWRFKFTIPFTFLIVVFEFLKRLKSSILDKVNVDKLNKIEPYVNAAIFVVNLVLAKDMIGCVNIALFIYALPYFVRLTFDKNKKIDNTFIIMFIGGACLSLAFGFSSDTGLDAMSIGFVLIGMMSGLFLMENDVISNLKLDKILDACVIILSLSLTAVLRLFSIYRDAPINNLDTQITKGPGKWLITTAKNAEDCENLYEDITANVRPEDTVMYSQIGFWCYLCTDNHYATPSSWRLPLNSPRIEEYFNSDTGNGAERKLPSCVFVIDEKYGAFESSLILSNEKADTPNSNELEGYLYDYLIENGYEKKDVKSGVIYLANQPN